MDEIYVDEFDAGRAAFSAGLQESNCPSGLNEGQQHYWIGGFRSAKRNAENPGLPVEEYFRIRDLADEAYKASKNSGERPVNPFPPDTEANDIWATRMLDCPLFYGDVEDDFVVLGRPTPVTMIAEHADGSVLCSIPARGGA